MPSKETKITDLKQEGEWVSLKAKVVQLWEPKVKSISQTGLLADETGKIKFVSWKKSKLPLMNKKENYLLRGVIVDSWNGTLQVYLNSRTKILQIEDDINANGVDVIEGKIARIVPKSGYVERCPECNRILVNNHCPVHVEVEPLDDLRIKVSLDSNKKILIINGEKAEKIVRIKLKKAKKMKKDDLDKLIND
ncbi:MAG: hypothetical protein U9N35_02780, partial [Euryarchaeota archaeon]|nr:hypothetical protein [Euryarchaeota archaeon]